eukprot:m.1486527 g.1486527  ORF g.1486527 m.1486527 type:complete len:281 (+) comp25184_c0_seq18:3640-4482(+)
MCNGWYIVSYILSLYNAVLFPFAGKFRQNGRCGYILKPLIMREDPRPGVPAFNPHDPTTFETRVDPLKIKIRIMSARHLHRAGRGVVSPFVELEIMGVPIDQNKIKTDTVQDNGLVPVWDQAFEFNVSFPELACLSIVVFDEDSFGEPVPIGQCVSALPPRHAHGSAALGGALPHFPLSKSGLGTSTAKVVCHHTCTAAYHLQTTGCLSVFRSQVLPIGPNGASSIRPGWRSVPLNNTYGAPLELSSVLLHVSPRGRGDSHVHRACSAAHFPVLEIATYV